MSTADRCDHTLDDMDLAAMTRCPLCEGESLRAEIAQLRRDREVWMAAPRSERIEAALRAASAERGIREGVEEERDAAVEALGFVHDSLLTIKSDDVKNARASVLLHDVATRVLDALTVLKRRTR
jgi:hypothetical protein